MTYQLSKSVALGLATAMTVMGCLPAQRQQPQLVPLYDSGSQPSGLPDWLKSNDKEYARGTATGQNDKTYPQNDNTSEQRPVLVLPQEACLEDLLPGAVERLRLAAGIIAGDITPVSQNGQWVHPNSQQYDPVAHQEQLTISCDYADANGDGTVDVREAYHFLDAIARAHEYVVEQDGDLSPRGAKQKK